MEATELNWIGMDLECLCTSFLELWLELSWFLIQYQVDLQDSQVPLSLSLIPSGTHFCSIFRRILLLRHTAKIAPLNRPHHGPYIDHPMSRLG